MSDDTTLLRCYVEHASEAAFAELVRRHIDLIYSAALRQTRQPALAQDVTQSVFVLLARKAADAATNPYLCAWLLSATRNIALDSLRREARRRAHERKAAQMARNTTTPPPAWTDIADLLDGAMALLSPADREVIVLRYFKGQDTRQLAAALNATPGAAKQRVHRALEKLRGILAKEGVAASPALLARGLARHAIVPAPAELAAHAVAAVHGVSIASSATTASTLTKGAALAMTATSTKLAAAGIFTLLAASGVTVALIRTEPPPPPPPVQLAAAAVLADAPDDDPNAWRKNFDAVYALGPDEAAKLVSPPFIPERQAFWNAQSRNGKAWPLHKEEHFIFGWTRNTPQWRTVSVGPQNLSFFLSAGVGLRPWELEGWKLADDIALPGDWSVRDNATEEAKLAIAELTVQQKLGRKIHFELRKVQQEVYVLSGNFDLKGVDPDRPRSLVYYAEPRVKPAPGAPRLIQHADFRFILDRIEDHVRRRIVDESRGRRPADIEFEDTAPDPAHQAQAMELFARQVGLQLRTEKREMDVWFLTETR